MRRIALLAAVTVASVALAGAADIFTQLGTTESSVREELLRAVNTGSLATGMAAKPYYALPAPAQAKLVEAYFAWARIYTASDTFKRAYAAQRDATKPQPRELPDPTSSAAKTEQQKEFEEMKKIAASLPSDQRKAMEQSLVEMQKQLAAFENDPEMKKAVADAMKMQREMNAKQHQEDLAEWNRRVPADPNVMIARRLRHLLDVSSTVDFDAKLQKSNGAMKFAETRYEDKPAEWKLCYRAGRTAVAAAQAAARAWLEELPAAR